MPNNDEPDIRDRRQAGKWEMHVQTLGIGVLMALSGWFGGKLFDNRDESRSANTKLEILGQQFAEFKTSTSHQLGQIQGGMTAMQLNFATRSELREIEVRVREVENARSRRP